MRKTPMSKLRSHDLTHPYYIPSHCSVTTAIKELVTHSDQLKYVVI
jgi:hypothetical protein